MNCGNCGAVQPDPARFCSQCGTELTAGNQRWQAPAAAYPPRRRRPQALAAVVAAVVVVLGALVVAGR
jgi:uncharacterized membrane protein YvbJ